MSGWRRPDGLFEIEGRLVDTKPFDIPGADGQPRPAGHPLHDMSVRWVVDEDLTLVEVHACTDASPHPVCPSAADGLKRLVGLRVGPGWNRAVRERLGASHARCTHLTELLTPMATAAFQSLWPVRTRREAALDGKGRPRQIDSCLAYAADGAVVKVKWPEHHRPGTR